MNYFNLRENSSNYPLHQERYDNYSSQHEFKFHPQNQQLQYSIGSEDKRAQISNSDYSYWNNYNSQHLNPTQQSRAKRSKSRRKKGMWNRKGKKIGGLTQQHAQIKQGHPKSNSSVIVISSDESEDDRIHVIEDDVKSQSLNFEIGHASSVVVLSDDQDNVKNELTDNVKSERYFTPAMTSDNVEKLKRESPPLSSVTDSTPSTSSTAQSTLHSNSNKRKYGEDINNNFDDVIPSKKTKHNTEKQSGSSSDDKFSQQIEQFFQTNQQQPSFLKKKMNLTGALEKAICRITYGNARLYIVGSSVNGFGRLTSDCDLCLVLNESTNDIGRKIVLRNLKDIQKLLWKTPFASNIVLIPARVPILKFYDNFGKIDCDLNVNNTIGLRNTYLLLAYSMQDPRVQPLGLCVKEWAHQCGINDASEGSLSSYTLILMVIHYLQCGTNPPVLPSLQQLYPHHFSIHKPLRNCEQAARSVPKYESKNLLSHSELLVGFFRYFATEFDFKNQVASIRLGKIIQVAPFFNQRDMTGKPIKVEEPFDHSNVARAVGFKSRLIISKFKNAYNALLSTHSDLRSILKLNTVASEYDCFTID